MLTNGQVSFYFDELAPFFVLISTDLYDKIPSGSSLSLRTNLRPLAQITATIGRRGSCFSLCQRKVLTMENKQEVVTKYSTHEYDTGSPEVQIALFTNRIIHLTEHCKMHPKDHHTRRGLLMLVGRRKRLLGYLKKVDINRYRSLIERLGLRR